MYRPLIRLSQQVSHALSNSRPIVALQSTIISHGMPYPENLKCALSIQKTVREYGAVPATIAIIDGNLQVGLELKMIQRLAEQGTKVKKISRRDLSYGISSKKLGATTVSATMIAAHMANIDIFVTGGIGGVHRGYGQTMDVSADLRQLGRTRVAVVSAGVKSILDIPRTLEYLQTQGVPVITYGSDYFPAFFSASSGIRSPFSSKSVQQIGEIIYSQSCLGLVSGILVAVPNPNPAEGELTENAIQQAVQQSKSKKISGAQTTPFLLKRVNQLTEGKSLLSNISLVHNNAKVGAQIAVSLKKTKDNKDSNLGHKTQNLGNNQDKKSPRSPLYNSSYKKQLQKPKLIVIGGSAVDYQFKPSPGREFELGKSCIGRSRRTLGGVARNIAQCASKLGVDSTLITALSHDPDGKSIAQHCQKYDINLIPIPSQKSTGKYLAIMDSSNNELIGISDMDINDDITFDNVYNTYLKDNGGKISPKDIVIVDANFHTASLAKLLMYLNEKKCFIVFEAKGQKSDKIISTGGYEYISMLKMNNLEKKQVFGDSQIGKKYVIGKLSQCESHKGIRAIITNGMSQLLKISDKGQITSFSIPQAQRVLKTTGAGDTLCGAFVSMLLRGNDVDCALKGAIKASKIAVQSDIGESVIPELSYEELLN